MALLLRCIPLSILVLALVGCQNLAAERKAPTGSKAALEQARQTNSQIAPPPALPPSLQRQLRQTDRNYNARQRVNLIDVAAKDVDAKVFFSSLVEGTSINAAIHPDVSGSITLNLSRVTLDEVLDTVKDIYGYDVRRQGRVMQVYPAGMRTETFAVNYLMLKRAGLSVTSVNTAGVGNESDDESGSSNNSDNDSSDDSNDQGQNGETNGEGSARSGTRIETVASIDLWTRLEMLLVDMVGVDGGRRVSVLPQAGLVSVKALPAEIREVRDFLETAETNLERQVVLEARILEVRLSDQYQQGIDWSAVTGQINGVGDLGDIDLTFDTSAGNFGNLISETIGNLTGLTISGADFNMVVNLLDTQGDVDTLSSPRVTAINNQKALIKVGTDEYFVTGVSSDVVTSGDDVVISPDIEITPFFEGIALDVTPQIDSDGEVLLHVRPSVIEIEEQNKIVNVSGDVFSLPLALSEVRESDTMVRAKSGDVVVIGGLMKTISQLIESRVPVLGHIPYFGELFTNRDQLEVKTELVILLRPVVVEPGTWKDQIQRSQQSLDDWYPDYRG